MQMDDVRLPMTQGSMDDITQEGEASSQVASSDLGVDSMSSQGAKAIYEREARIVIDYEKLSDEYQDVSLLMYWYRYHLYVYYIITKNTLYHVSYLFAAGNK